MDLRDADATNSMNLTDSFLRLMRIIIRVVIDKKLSKYEFVDTLKLWEIHYF